MAITRRDASSVELWIAWRLTSLKGGFPLVSPWLSAGKGSLLQPQRNYRLIPCSILHNWLEAEKPPTPSPR
jgi:hypothetical protein